MNKPIKVVLLPTEDKSSRLIYNDSNQLCHQSNKSFKNDRKNRTRVHVYITTSQDVEPIKSGDWFLHNDTKNISQHHDIDNSLVGHWFKIIATTDKKLTKMVDTDSKVYPKQIRQVPQLQQQFLKEFVANPDGEWEVEYENVVEFTKISGVPYPAGCKLKLNQDNEVTITSVEDKMYSKEEVESLLFQYAKDEHAWFSCKSEIESFNNWIKENLNK